MKIHYKWPFSSSQTVNVDQAGSLKQMSKMSFRFPGSEPESLRGSAGHPWRLLSHDGAMVLVEKWKKMTGVFLDGIHGAPKKQQHR